MESRNTTNITKACSLVLIYGIPGVGKSLLLKTLSKQASKDITIIRINFDKNEGFLKCNTQILPDITHDFFKCPELETLLTIKVPQDEFILTETMLLEKLTKNNQCNKIRVDDYVPLIWKKTRTIAFALTKAIVEILSSRSSLLKPHVLIIEDNFLLKSMRKPYYRMAGEFGLGFCQIRVNAELDLCIKRNSQRKSEKLIPENKIREAQEKLENSPYFEHEITFWNNSNSLEDSEIKNIWLSMLKIINERNIILTNERKEEEQMIAVLRTNQVDFLHRLDLQLRAVVGYLLSSQSKDHFTTIISKKIILKLQDYEIKQEDLRTKALIFSFYKSVFLDLISLISFHVLKCQKKNIMELCCLEETRIFKTHEKSLRKFPNELHFAKCVGIKNLIEEICTFWEVSIQDIDNLEIEWLIHKLVKVWIVFIFEVLNIK